MMQLDGMRGVTRITERGGSLGQMPRGGAKCNCKTEESRQLYCSTMILRTSEVNKTDGKCKARSEIPRRCGKYRSCRKLEV